jgi:hypothetical protein
VRVIRRGARAAALASAHFNDSSYKRGIYSSAIIVKLDQVTDFLKTHDTPP